MTQPISDLVNDKTYRHLMGVDDTRPNTCDEHGDYIEIHCSGERRSAPKGWKGCPKCQQARWDAEVKKQAAKEQQEREAQKMERLIRDSRIPARFQGKTFENFEAHNRKAASHLDKLREYADLIVSGDHGGRSLILLGKVGNGKTHLGCALLADVIRRTARGGAYWTFAELVRAIKGSYSKGAEYSESDVYERVGSPALAVIDEVGMQNFTEFEQTVAYEVINRRYLDEKPTVLITNLQAKDLPTCIGERAVDRLRENGGKALDFDWPSYRAGGAA